MADNGANEVSNIEKQPREDDKVDPTDKVEAGEAETTEQDEKDAEVADDKVNEAGDAVDDAQDNEASRKRKSLTVEEGDIKKAKTDDDAEVPASNGVEETTKTADDVVQRLENEEEVAA